MIVGSFHLYKTRRVGLMQAQKDTEDVAVLAVSAETPLEAIGQLRVLLATLEEQMADQEERKKDNPVKGTGEKPLTGRQRRSHLIDDEEDEDEIED